MPVGQVMACERCVYLSGAHAEWCEIGRKWRLLNEQMRESFSRIFARPPKENYIPPCKF